MIQIWFLSPTGFGPMKDAVLKSLTNGSHGYGNDPWVFGVVEVDPQFANAADVRKRMGELGIILLPAIDDTGTPVPKEVTQALKQWVSSSDHTRQIAKKMASLHVGLAPNE